MAGGFQKQIQSPYFATGNPTTEELTTLYAPGMLGCYTDFDMGLASGPPNVCRFRLVQQGAAIQAGVGAVLYWYNKGTWVVTTDRSVGQLAGICQKATAAVNTYIWVGLQGDLSVLFIDTPTVTPAAGLPVVAADGTDGKADCLSNANAQAAFPLIGVALGAATSHIGSVRLDIPDAF